MTNAHEAAKAMRDMAEEKRLAADAKMPNYGKLPWDDLIAAVGAARGFPWTPDPTYNIGHQMVGVFNMNSLNRVVTYFCELAALSLPEAPPAPETDEALREAARRPDELRESKR
jgi:hypothetical protein